MRYILFALSACAVFALSAPTRAGVTALPIYSNIIVEHGGGCRKSSPPGQCCHMETQTGIVHCH